ncbi:ankyrin repeat-containing domain protein [Aspergillus welwitschiae]|uniref:Ankyrin repeat-containing domain protein n=1 Tax=Aspergillus welwitschiae TaxID=1341132 RepID=A0A3F3Q9W9_9EURO|nr:ankyrin repeat-containing domain protein [Aspergillus welwitschiae]RDH35948.1 ankyrin repeat-containing domain protein [Aspergillus welwitschiae]
MRLLSERRSATGSFIIELEEFPDVPSDKYAILSHTWGKGEVSLYDLQSGLAGNKQGFKKIRKCCAKALDDGFKYTWIDTCCIDKTSSAELFEAINSMYRWYQEADICYVYLDDFQSECDTSSSRWFTRGWTLQELIAPQRMKFLNKEWKELGTKENMQALLSGITGIPSDILTGRKDLESISIAQRMSWAARRVTTRIEDQAYSLLGIFGINIPLIYGEGKRSFIRLQEEILRVSDDQSIFAWKSPGEHHGGLLASSPGAFRDSANIVSHNAFSRLDKPITQSNKGIHLELRLIGKAPGLALAILNCIDRAKGDLLVALYLRDPFMTMEQFERVQCTELNYTDLRKYKCTQYPMRRICVKQRRLTDLKQQALSDVQLNISENKSVEDIIGDRERTKHNSMENNWEILSSFTARGDIDSLWGRSLLSEAAYHGHVPIVKLLLARDDLEFDACDIDHRTPLSFAASAGHVSVIQLLLETSKVSIDSRDVDDLTPLAWAAQNGHEKAVISLLENGAYVDSMNDWWWKAGISIPKGEIPLKTACTPLCLAARNGHYGVVRQLLASGADINTMDLCSGRTPLSFAAGNGHNKVVQLLLSKGAGVESKDIQFGRTPLAWAMENGYSEIVQRLQSEGTDTHTKDNQ